MENKKGQAAMEFLMTYGWAILAAIIAIGVLAYFYFSPGNMTPNAVVINAPFYAVAGTASAANGVNLELKNGGDAITVSSTEVKGCGTSTTPVAFTAGEQKVIAITCTPALAVDTTLKGDIIVTYAKTGSELNLTSTGSISAKVGA